MNQQQLYSEFLAKLLAVCNKPIVAQMTLDTYMQTIIAFSAGSILYACDSMNRLDLYDADTISDEIKNMMIAMKDSHNETPTTKA